MERSGRRRQPAYLRNYVYATDPGTAAMLSVVPGIGQIYNGERRKGILFLDVAIINLVVIGLLLMTRSIGSGLEILGNQFHFAVNADVARILGRSHAGSPLFLIYMSMALSFVVYAVRDAYKRAGMIKRNPIYRSQILELSEAASGSYIFHVTAIFTFLFLALFCVMPKPAETQITEIEFAYNQPEVKKPIKTDIASDKQSVDSGKHQKNKDIKAPSKGSSAESASKPKTQSRPYNKPAYRPVTPPRVVPPGPGPIARNELPAPHRPVVRHATPSLPAPAAPVRKNILPAPAVPRPVSHLLTRNAPPVPSKLSTVRPGNGPLPRPAINGNPLKAAALPTLPAPVRLAPGGQSGKLPSIRPDSNMIASLPSAPAVTEVGGGKNSGEGSKPQPQPVFSGSKTGSGKETGGNSLPAPTAIKSKPGNSGGRMIAVAPSINKGASGKQGSGTAGNPRANARPDGPPSIAAVPVDFGPYMADLQKRIKRAWFPPRGQESRRVVVTFSIDRKGGLSHLSIAKGSGVASADKAALDAVANAAPFRRLPAGADSSVDIEFTFDYNVFTGGRGRFRTL